ncbi:ferredoxin reductase [Pseudonocardia broussonetiae]|uniref:Oxidoreductase n=1 Tax=Pseudonocardia broussonetiae TaxID=2736640 RepID=A0A6M6JP69_9PSEU|nr:ferredoxin reductase [Pseudonocardia broussonetiae]QJY48747.1 oxidoreductase [Pseudonocardia broussonetiae]
MTDTSAGTTHRRTLRWQQARVVSVRDETPTARTLRLALPDPRPHLPGQHYVVRLTAPDGYTASRAYSVASAPDGTNEVELTVERLPDGEVSEYLHDVAEPGDELEVRGPIGGGFFAWTGDTPALLVGGGSGVVPLMAMLRHARAIGRPDLVRLVVSARTGADLYYADELAGPETTVVLTRADLPGRPRGRLTADDLAPLVRADEVVFVCGSPAFCDGVTDLLAAVGVPVGAIRTERFGPSG